MLHEALYVDKGKRLSYTLLSILITSMLIDSEPEKCVSV